MPGSIAADNLDNHLSNYNNSFLSWWGQHLQMGHIVLGFCCNNDTRNRTMLRNSVREHDKFKKGCNIYSHLFVNLWTNLNIEVNIGWFSAGKQWLIRTYKKLTLFQSFCPHLHLMKNSGRRILNLLSKNPPLCCDVVILQSLDTRSEYPCFMEWVFTYHTWGSRQNCW